MCEIKMNQHSLKYRLWTIVYLSPWYTQKSFQFQPELKKKSCGNNRSSHQVIFIQ